MKFARVFRVALGIIAVILACWSCVGIVGMWCFVPKTPDMNIMQEVEWNTLYTLMFVAIAVGFAWVARWCFTGRVFRRLPKAGD